MSAEENLNQSEGLMANTNPQEEWKMLILRMMSWLKNF